MKNKTLKEWLINSDTVLLLVVFVISLCITTAEIIAGASLIKSIFLAGQRDGLFAMCFSAFAICICPCYVLFLPVYLFFSYRKFKAGKGI